MLLVRLRAGKGTQNRRSRSGYRGTRAKSEGPRDGQMAVLAEHSTDGQVSDREGGEPRPTGPTEGKATPGITFCWKERWEILRGHKLSQRNFSELQSKQFAIQRWCSRRWRTR